MKKYFYVVSLIFILSFTLVSGKNVFAGFVPSDDSYQSLCLKETTENEVKIKNGIVRKEIINYYHYDYGDKFSSNGYKYAAVSANVSYINQNQEIIASAYFEATFRYNEKLGVSKCLSTSYGQTKGTGEYSVEIFGRTKNLALDIGESFGKITLSGTVSDKDVCRFIFSCDSKGNISRIII